MNTYLRRTHKLPTMAQNFFDLPNDKKDMIKDDLMNIGLCMINKKSYQHILLKGKSSSVGKLNKIYFQLSKLSKQEMDNVITIMVT